MTIYPLLTLKSLHGPFDDTHLGPVFVPFSQHYCAKEFTENAHLCDILFSFFVHQCILRKIDVIRKHPRMKPDETGNLFSI